MMRRLFLFLRSVIPQDPAQLLFIVGSFLLLICMQLRCYPLPYESLWLQVSAKLNSDPYLGELRAWNLYSVGARLPIVFAGAAAFVIGFWPGPRPLRRTVIFVCIPALAGITLLCIHYLPFAAYWNPSNTSVLQNRPYSQMWVLRNLWSLGPALHMSVLGIVLILLFLSRQAMGLATLPLRLPQTGQSDRFLDEEWSGIVAFVWGLIPGGIILNLVTLSLYVVAIRIWSNLSNVNVSSLNTIFGTVSIGLLACAAALIAGKNPWEDFKSFTRLPKVRVASIAGAIAVAVDLIPNLVAYTWDRIQWGIHGLGKYSPPQITSYFQFPDPVFLWFFPAAFVEEVIWRGYLQPRFIQRFGILRGLFLVGLSWGALHFLRDFQGTIEDHEIPLKLFYRLALCVAMSYVFGWLALRSDSIWPSVLVHGLHNVWVFSRPQFYIRLEEVISPTLVLICYSFLGYLLFKYWPPPAMADEEGESAPSPAELPT
jgi:membrane protease YdiL (CAAX protease family)